MGGPNQSPLLALTGGRCDNLIIGAQPNAHCNGRAGTSHACCRCDPGFCAVPGVTCTPLQPTKSPTKSPTHIPGEQCLISKHPSWAGLGILACGHLSQSSPVRGTFASLCQTCPLAAWRPTIATMPSGDRMSLTAAHQTHAHMHNHFTNQCSCQDTNCWTNC